MSWLPDSMFGRLFVAVCAPIVVMLVISYTLVMRDRQALSQRLGGSGDIVSQVVALTRQWSPLLGAARVAAVEAFNLIELEAHEPQMLEGGGRRPRPMDEDGSPLSAGRLRDVEVMYLAPVRRQLGGDCVASATGASSSHGLVADLALPPLRPQRREMAPMLPDREFAPRPEEPGGRRGGGGLIDLTVRCATADAIVFRLPPPPMLPEIQTTLAWQLLSLAAMLGAVLWLATRRLTRPLTELQHVASAMGRALPPPPIRESGAREVRDTLRAFNTMQDRLRRYLDSRTRVLVAMSHDLRTPLTRLRLRAESIDQTDVRNRLVADIEEMDTLVHRSLGLFRGLDDDEAPMELDINLLLQGLAAESLELGHEVPVQGQALYALRARPQSLRRAMRNLVENAIKYGKAARIDVRDDTQALTISVCDQGPGIPEAQLESVCEPFRRLDDSRSRETGGVGLGLAIASDIAELHGGTLQLRNLPEGGLAATLVLPRAP